MKKILLVLFLVLTVGNQIVLASETSPHHLSFGPEVSYIKYEEPDIMEEKGVMYGVFGKYAFHANESQSDNSLGNVMLGVDGRVSFGQVDYESNGTGTIDDIDDFIGEVSPVIGYDFELQKNTRLTPYLGFGYRYLQDELGGKISTTGHAGYDRETQYWYLPMGVSFDNHLPSDWVWGFNVEYDLFLSGQQKSHLEDVDASLSTLENDQDKGFGVRGSFQLAKSFADWQVKFEPFIRYWEIDESNIGTITCGGTPCALGYEPENRSIEYGMRIGAEF